MPQSIFISAGEASGEHYGALLADALKKRLDAAGQTAIFFGMGGQRMAEAGVECVVRSEDMAVMGLTEIVRHLPRIYREYCRLKQAIRERRPSVAVLIDFPEIHFRLARELHRLGIPVLYFVSPQLWAWKKKRIRLVRKYIDRMLVIFPFEEPFYQERAVAAEFVGHPLAELPLPAVSRAQFAAENGLDPAKTWIGLLPGSRPKEIRDHLPEMLRAARGLADSTDTFSVGNTGPSTALRSAQDDKSIFEFIVPLAPTLNAAQREEVRRLTEAHGSDLALRLVDDARATLLHARASVVASGTATVEAALIGNPFVVVYHVSTLTFAIAKRVVTVPHVAMANLMAGKQIVPELIQSEFTAENIVREVKRLLPDGPQRQSMMDELARMRGLLKIQRVGGADGAIDRVSEVALEMLAR